MGLRLAALEALQCGGVVEFGEREAGTWQVRLVVPPARTRRRQGEPAPRPCPPEPSSMPDLGVPIGAERMPDAARSPERLSVLVVDDHDVVHWGFRLMLTQQPWVERCVSAHTGTEALAMAARYRPHVRSGRPVHRRGVRR